MSNIEKMNQYIERTHINHQTAIRYGMNVGEWLELLHSGDPATAIHMAFKYGQAKGYRAAKAKSK